MSSMHSAVGAFSIPSDAPHVNSTAKPPTAASRLVIQLSETVYWAGSCDEVAHCQLRALVHIVNKEMFDGNEGVGLETNQHCLWAWQQQEVWCAAVRLIAGCRWAGGVTWCAVQRDIKVATGLWEKLHEMCNTLKFYARLGSYVLEHLAAW